MDVAGRNQRSVPQCGLSGCARTLPAMHWEQNRMQQDGALRGAPCSHRTFCNSCCLLKVTPPILILLAVVRLPIYVNAAFCSPPASGFSAINIFKQSHKTAALPDNHVLLLHAGRRLLVPPVSRQSGAGSLPCKDHQHFC